jgi:SAM-dependent methyltransferase
LAASLVYSSPLVYEGVMILLYGRHYLSRYRALDGLIPAGSSVVELCCGPGFLFDRYLRHRSVSYTGLDSNPRFIERLGRRGGRGEVRDLGDETPLPESDYVIMQASLYQFLPDAGPVVGRMRRAARVQVIIAEPVRNLASGGLPVVAALAARQTDAGFGDRPRRFTEQTLDDFFASLPTRPSRSFLIPGGREKVYILDAGPNDGGPRLT